MLNDEPKRPKWLANGRAVAFCLLVLAAGNAFAGRIITSVTLDGGASVTVAPGQTISATLNVTTSGISSDDDWDSSAWLISITPPGPSTCNNHSNHGGDGDYQETISIAAPSAPGTYNAYFIAYHDSACTTGASAVYTMSNAVVVSAGTVFGGCSESIVGSDTLITCTGNGSFVPPTGVTTVRYLVVAGGGGGGGIGTGNEDGAGGGGAGGVLSSTGFAVTAGTPYSIVVGSGGTAGTGSANGGNGGNSTFSTLTAIGGGGGAREGGRDGADGGSGGGGSDNDNGGAGTAGQGNDGGDGNNNNGGGGGGGAGAAGQNGGANNGGNGGNGVSNDITGTATYYGGGGGGGADDGATGGTGGLGGGGSGATGRGAGIAGTANTGGGGGGATGSGSGSAFNGGAGGSGIVILRYTTTALHHYGISYPLGAPGVTCEALAVRITAHDASHAAAAPSASTQITLSTSAAAGGWALKSGSGTFTAPNLYAFDGSETYAEFWLTQTTPTTSPHIDIDVTDGTHTDVDGDAGEDAKAEFVDTAFKYYACTGAIPGACSEVSINSQIAGKPSNTAPGAQSLYLRAVKKDTTTSACTGGLVDAQDVEFGYECDSPATCYAGNLMSINGGTATTIARNNDGTISAGSGTYTNVAMTFDANGFAPFNLNHSDAGLVTLHARKTVTAGTGTPPSTAATLYGASNSFAVRPFAFELTVPSNPKATAYNGTIFKAAGDDFDATVRGVVWQAADDADNDGLPDSGADLSGNAATPSFAWATALSADSTSGSYTPLPAQGGVLGTLAPSPATLAQASFSGGQASASGQTPSFYLNWSEVGSFTLKADATDYLGVSGLNVSSSAVVGRFTPHHFGLTGSVTNRSDLATPGGAFTYMDEPMKLTLVVTAYAKADTVTKNYVGNFAKLDAATLGTGANWFNTGCAGATQCFGLGAVNDTATDTGLSGRLSVVGAGTYATVTDPTSNWPTGASAGSGTFTLHVKLARNATPDGPYDTLKIGGMPRDSEGVTLPAPASSDAHKVDLDATTGDTLASNPDGTSERRLVFTTQARFGRLWMGNAYGTDRQNLTVPFEAQHWNGNAFVTNTLDSLTGLATGNIAFGNPQGGLAGYAGPVVSASNPVAAGKGSIVLTKPGTSVPGSIDLVVNLGAAGGPPTDCQSVGGGTSAAMAYLAGKWCGSNYDRNPVARATFGVFGSSLKKGPIYIRESH